MSFFHLLISPMETWTSALTCLATEVFSKAHKSTGSRKSLQTVSSKNEHHEGTVGWKGNLESCAQPLPFDKTEPVFTGELGEVGIHHLGVSLPLFLKAMSWSEVITSCSFPTAGEFCFPVLSTWIPWQDLPCLTQKTKSLLPKSLFYFLGKETSLS